MNDPEYLAGVASADANGGSSFPRYFYVEEADDHDDEDEDVVLGQHPSRRERQRENSAMRRRILSTGFFSQCHSLAFLD